MIGLVINFEGNTLLSYCIIAFSIITLLFYPLYEKRQYIKHYKKHIEENYTNRIGKSSTIEFNNEYLISKSDSQEGKIKLTEITEVNETKTNLFIKVKSGESIIIPSNLPEYNLFKSDLLDRINTLEVLWNIDLKWKW